MPVLPSLARADRQNWTEPGAELVAAGVHRIPLPLPSDGLRAVNVYAIATDEGLTLIDGGWALPVAEEALTNALRDIGFSLGDIRTFLVTHAHRDHYTQASALRERFDVRVALGALEWPTVEFCQRRARGEHVDDIEVGMLRRAGATELADIIERHAFARLYPRDWAAPDTSLDDGQSISVGTRTVTAHHTPGHTRGHLIFRDADAGLLFAGDHVLPHITPSVGFEPIRQESPLRAYLASLALVRAMPDALLLPAHGPATGSVHERVDELLAHHAERLDLTSAALRAGCDTAYAVAAHLGWTRRHTRLEDLDPFNRILAVLETVAHLDVLIERGLVGATDDDRGLRHYHQG